MSNTTREALTSAKLDLGVARNVLVSALAGYENGDLAANRTAVEDAITAWTAAADAYDIAAADWQGDR